MTGPLFILLASLLWAFDAVLRRSLFVLPPTTIVFLEHLIGFLLLLPFFLPRIKKTKLTPEILGLSAFVALVASLLGTLFFTMALTQVAFIPFSVVILLQKLQPLFAIGLSAVLLKERLTPKFLFFALIAIIAAFFVTFPLGQVAWTGGAKTIQAALLAVAAAACWGSATPFSKKLLSKVSVTVATGLRFGFGTLFGLMAVLVIGNVTTVSQVNPTQLGTLVAIALSTGMVAMWLYYRGLSQTQAKVAAILELSWPLAAVVIDVVLYDTVLHPSQYLAAIVLLFAMWQVTRSTQLPARSTSETV